MLPNEFTRPIPMGLANHGDDFGRAQSVGAERIAQKAVEFGSPSVRVRDWDGEGGAVAGRGGGRGKTVIRQVPLGVQSRERPDPLRRARERRADAKV